MLRLGWNRLGPKGGKALAEGLRFCSSGLAQLSLPWSGITDVGASHIAKVGVMMMDRVHCRVAVLVCPCACWCAHAFHVKPRMAILSVGSTVPELSWE